MKLTLAGIFLVLISSQSVAEECKTELNANDNYGDLSKILACMSEKIRSLDEKVRQLQSHSVANLSDSACGPETTDKFTASLIPTIKGSKLKSQIKIRNNKQEPFLIVVDDNIPISVSSNVYPIDIKSTSAPSGIGHYSQSSSGPANREDLYTHIEPGQTISISFLFDLNTPITEKGETDITITVPLLNLSNGTIYKVNASPCAVMTIGN